MTDFTRRTLRTWAVLDGFYALVLLYVAAALVPWKTPWVNGLLLLYAAAHVASAPGLWRGARWAWRVAVVSGLLGLLGAVVVVGGLLVSWAYLKSIYGDFGRGASIACLLFASVAAQLLGLYPALRLRALLRREVRADVGVAGRRLLAALWGVVIAPCVLAGFTHARYDLEPVAPLTEAQREVAMAVIGDAVRRGVRSPADALAGVPLGAGPLYVTVWHRGAVAARVAGDGADLAEAVGRAADALLAERARRDGWPRAARIKLDRVVAVAPVLSEAVPVVALSVNPGLDGLRRRDADPLRAVLPDDLLRASRFGVAPLVPGIQEVRLGLDAAPVLRALGDAGGPLQRFRTEGYVSSRDGPRPVVRGNTPIDPPDAAAFARAAIAGGDFILRQIRKDGRFHYQYFALDDRHTRGGEYSIPRHAGTVYSLALLFGLTGEDRFRRGAQRGMEWLIRRIPERCGVPEHACVPRGDQAELGGAALTLVGVLEYQRRTGDRRHQPAAVRLADFIVSMQRDDDDFHHLFDLKTGRPVPEVRSMFYSEEAALALVMAHEAIGDARYLAAAERALDFLTGPKYAYFVGGFIYGADHWTCIAAEEAWPRLKSPDYLDFCRGYSAFIRRMQYEPAGWQNADFRGHYGFSGLMVPQAPAAAGFSEAVVSTWLLSQHHGAPDEALREQAFAALAALTRDQLRPDNAYLAVAPLKARGGIRRSLVEPEVRIDFAQHSVAALIRGAQL